MHLVVGEFKLRLGLSSGAKYERAFKIPAPTGNIETLFRMLQTHLETVRTDAPIASLRLEATPSLPEMHQLGLFVSTLVNPNQFAETLARLTAFCGSERVGMPVPKATHRPDAFHMKPPEFTGAVEVQPGNRMESENALGLQLRRFRPPVSAAIEFREKRPVLFRSPTLEGTITDARGPFVSSGHWWDERRWAREEWDVQTSNGALYRLCCSPEGFVVEGIYD